MDFNRVRGIQRQDRPIRRACAAVALVVAGLTSCGNSSTDEPESTGTTISPLAELMGWQSDSPEESRRKQLQVEELTAACMREEGWEYTPVDWSAQGPEVATEDEALMADQEAYGRKYGYGVVHNYEQWEEPSLNGEEVIGKDPRQFEDPNQEYVSTLSPSESEEYYQSLYGGGVLERGGADGFGTAPATAATVAIAEDPTGTVGVDVTSLPAPMRPEDQGCSGRASAEVYGADPMQSNPDLQSRMNDYWEDSQNDPRLLSANDEWFECMADVVDGLLAAGEPITKPEQMYSYLDRLKYEAMGLEIVPFDQNDTDQQYYTAWSDESGKGEAAVGEPVPIPEDELEQLRQTELELLGEGLGVPAGRRLRRDPDADRAGAGRRTARRLPRARIPRIVTAIDPDRPRADDAAAGPSDPGRVADDRAGDLDADESSITSSVDDGRRRRMLALAVVGAAVISAVGGAVVGSQLQSPADAAQDRRPPVASRITIPVTRQALSSSITLAGEIQFAEPTPIKLAGSVGIPSTDTAVVTKAPEIDDEATEGDVLFDISGRPVFVLQGTLPTYRSLAPGTIGPDVLQLEEALERLGYNPGPIDTTYDGYTAAALDAMYADAGYRSVGPSDEENEQLRQLRTAVTDGEEALARAEADLATAGQQITGAQLLGLQQAASQAADAVPLAEAQAFRNNVAATQAVNAATTGRDASITARDAARSSLDLASAPGAIDPATGDPYSQDEIAARRGALAEAEVSLAERATALIDAQNQQASTAAQGDMDDPCRPRREGPCRGTAVRRPAAARHRCGAYAPATMPPLRCSRPATTMPPRKRSAARDCRPVKWSSCRCCRPRSPTSRSRQARRPAMCSPRSRARRRKWSAECRRPILVWSRKVQRWSSRSATSPSTSKASSATSASHRAAARVAKDRGNRVACR